MLENRPILPDRPLAHSGAIGVQKPTIIRLPAVLTRLIMPNKQKFPHLLGSKWTAREATFGWRHFQVVNRKQEGDWVFAEMVSSCDATVRFWINAKILKDRHRWMPGWKTLEEIQAADAQKKPS